MSVPRLERIPQSEEVPGGEQSPAVPSWQHWLEGFQAMCANHNIDPAALTAGKRPFFTIVAADHLHHDTADYYASRPDPATERAARARPVPLPHRLTHSRLQEYYHKFPAEPVDAPPDRIRTAARLQHQTSYRGLAYEASNRFREIRIAQLLRSHFANSGQAEAAESMRELLTTYGMVVESLRTYASNAAHPPPLMETAYAAEGAPPLAEPPAPSPTDSPTDDAEMRAE